MGTSFENVKATVYRDGKLSQMTTGKLRLDGSRLILKTLLMKHPVVEIHAVTRLERHNRKLTIHTGSTHHILEIHQLLDEARTTIGAIAETLGHPLAVDEDRTNWENNPFMNGLISLGKTLFRRGPGFYLLRSKPFWGVILALGILGAIFGEPPPPQTSTPDGEESAPGVADTQPAPGLTYTVFSEEVDDTPVKTQVSLKVVLTSSPEAITKQAVNTLLTTLYTEVMGRTGYTYHGGSPTSAYLFVYTDEARARSGAEWIGTLGKCHACKAPNVGFADNQFAQLLQPEEEKFGLSESTRKEVYAALIRAEDRAGKEAEALFPSDPTQALKKGDTFKTTQRTPLIPRFDVDPMQGLRELVQLPPGTRLTIRAVESREDQSFYKVRAKPPAGRTLTGWIQPIALMGQSTVEPLKQLQKQATEMEKRETKYDEKIAQQYNLTAEQLDAISTEGLVKSWPMPTLG